MRDKKITVRFTEEEYKSIQMLKEGFLSGMGLSLTDSDIVRQGVIYMYNESVKKANSDKD